MNDCLEILAVCGPCSSVMQVIWNGVGEPHCPSCGAVMSYSVLGPADEPDEAPVSVWMEQP